MRLIYHSVPAEKMTFKKGDFNFNRVHNMNAAIKPFKLEVILPYRGKA